MEGEIRNKTNQFATPAIDFGKKPDAQRTGASTDHSDIQPLRSDKLTHRLASTLGPNIFLSKGEQLY